MPGYIYHQAIVPAHLLLALLRQEEGVVPATVTKIAGKFMALEDEFTKDLEARPKVYGSGMTIGLLVRLRVRVDPHRRALKIIR